MYIFFSLWPPKCACATWLAPLTCLPISLMFIQPPRLSLPIAAVSIISAWRDSLAPKSGMEGSRDRPSESRGQWAGWRRRVVVFGNRESGSGLWHVVKRQPWGFGLPLFSWSDLVHRLDLFCFPILICFCRVWDLLVSYGFPILICFCRVWDLLVSCGFPDLNFCYLWPWIPMHPVLPLLTK
jgi:hypothetical protein